MADGADYPGYSEPEPEKEPIPIVNVQRGFWEVILKYSGLPFIVGIIASGKMVIASLLGAFLATNMGFSLESLLPFILNMMVIFLILHILQHFIENDVPTTLPDVSNYLPDERSPK